MSDTPKCPCGYPAPCVPRVPVHWCKAPIRSTERADTMGKCPNKNAAGVCQMHNLQCGYPKCEQGAVSNTQKPVAIVETVVPHLRSIVVKALPDGPMPNIGDWLYTTSPVARDRIAELEGQLSTLRNQGGRIAELERELDALQYRLDGLLHGNCSGAMQGNPLRYTPHCDTLRSELAEARRALQFYADGNHFVLADDDAWDTVSGEPQNFWCDEAGTATVEDGSVAKAALAGKPLHHRA